MSACVVLKNEHSAKSVGLVTSYGIDLSSVNKKATLDLCLLLMWEKVTLTLIMFLLSM